MRSAVLWIALGSMVSSPARAGHCGESNCGPEGVCREQSLIARCQCDDGWFGVTTYLGGGSQGAHCVRIPADPESEACEGLACGPNGSCVGDEAGVCLCDPGYAPSHNTCVDDPDDDSEAPCRDVRCGEGASCMVTPDGPTCRCKGGEFVVLGLDARGQLGPVCQAPADPGSACGAEACGGAGTCVISQAAFCRCDSGYSVEERQTPDGRNRPYCVDSEGNYPLPAEGEGEGEGERDVGGVGDDGGDNEPPPAATRSSQEGCTQSDRAAGGAWLPRR